MYNSNKHTKTFLNYVILYMSMGKIIRPITLEVDEETWQTFKERVPRTVKLNDKLVELVEREIQNKHSSNK